MHGLVWPQFLWQWRLLRQADEMWDACFAAISHAFLQQVHVHGCKHAQQELPVVWALLGQPEMACTLIQALLAFPESQDKKGAPKFHFSLHKATCVAQTHMLTNSWNRNSTTAFTFFQLYNMAAMF